MQYVVFMKLDFGDQLCFGNVVITYLGRMSWHFILFGRRLVSQNIC